MKDRIALPTVEVQGSRGERTTVMGADAARVLIERLAAADERIAALERKGGRAGIVTSDYSAKAGEFINVEARSGTLVTIALPESTPALRNARVTTAFRNTNPVRIVAVRGTVNRQAFVINEAVGTYDAICDGLGGWSVSILATPEGIALPPTSPGGAALNAEYALGASHPSLPNGRVATANAEITPSVATPNVISWALNAASVAFSKLANLTGLSVLGRAANSAGVMAAITATAARQTLRANDAGTALEWGHPVEVRDSGADQGDAFALDFVAGTNVNLAASVAGGVATITPSVDLSSVTYSAGDGIDLAGNQFSADVSDFAGTGIEDDGSNNLRIAAAAAGAGLTGGSGSALAVGAGTGITVNANDVQLSALAAETFFGNFTAGSAVGTARAGSSVAGAGLTYTAGGTLAVGAGANVTVGADSVSVDNYPLSGLADQAANTIVTNATAGTAAPTAVAVSSDSVLARVGGNLVSHPWSTLAGGGLTYSAGVMAVGAGTYISVAANSIDWFGFDLHENGIPASAGWKGFDLIDGDHISWTLTAPGFGLLGVEPTLDLAAAYTWTGIHRHDTYIAFGDPGLIAAGDVRKNSLLEIVGAGVRVGTLAGGGELTLDTGSTGEAFLEGNTVQLWGSQGVRVASGGTGGSTGQLYIKEGSNSFTVPSGDGLVWVRDDTPNVLMYTNDDDEDFVMQFAHHRRASLTTQTNSTNNAIATTHTIPANSIRDGDTYRLTGCYRYDRGSTATASQLRGFFSVGGGITVSTGNISTQTANGSSGTIRIEAIVTFLDDASAATPYTASVLLIDTINSATVVTRLPTPSITATVDGTADFSLSIRAQFTAAVANLSVTALQGCVERIG